MLAFSWKTEARIAPAGFVLKGEIMVNAAGGVGQPDPADAGVLRTDERRHQRASQGPAREDP